MRITSRFVGDLGVTQSAQWKWWVLSLGVPGCTQVYPSLLPIRSIAMRELYPSHPTISTLYVTTRTGTPTGLSISHYRRWFHCRKPSSAQNFYHQLLHPVLQRVLQILETVQSQRLTRSTLHWHKRKRLKRLVCCRDGSR